MCNSLNFMTRFYEFLLSSKTNSLTLKQTHRLSASVGRFSNVDPVLYPVLRSGFTMRTDRHFEVWEQTETRPQVLTWSRTGYENRFKCVHVYWGGGEPDRFSHRTQIRFSEFSVSFIGSSHLGLLLFSCCYYSSLYYYLLFSHFFDSFPVAVTFLTWCCFFSVMK